MHVTTECHIPTSYGVSDEVILVLVSLPVDVGEKEDGLVFVEGCFRDPLILEASMN